MIFLLWSFCAGATFCELVWRFLRAERWNVTSASKRGRRLCGSAQWNQRLSSKIAKKFHAIPFRFSAAATLSLAALTHLQGGSSAVGSSAQECFYHFFLSRIHARSSALTHTRAIASLVLRWSLLFWSAVCVCHVLWVRVSPWELTLAHQSRNG